MSAFTAGFTHQLLYQDVRDLDRIAIAEILGCVKSGIHYLRRMMLLKTGWPVPVDGSDPKFDPGGEFILPAEPAISDAFIPSPFWYRPRNDYIKESSWSIFIDNYDRKLQLSETINNYTENIVLQAASWAARNGLKALKHVTYLECRKLFTIDRHDIESLRNIRRLLSRY
jgi:hypothetical protein